MKEMNDEELQQFIEQQLKAGTTTDPVHQTDDERLYRELFTALAQEPFILKQSLLADHVAEQIEHMEAKKEAKSYRLGIAAILAGSLLFIVVTMLLFSPSVLKVMSADFINYKGIILFSTAAFVFIQWADKKLIGKPTIV